MTMEHQLVSELVGDLVHGRLTPEVESEVQAHLGACPECRLELEAVTALSALPVGRLEGAERVALRDAVRPRAMPRRSPWARLAPALGAVGLVAVIAVGAATLLTGRGEDTGGDASISAPEKADRDAGGAAAGGAGAEAHKGAAEEFRAKDSQADQTGNATTAGQSLAFGPLSVAELGPLGPELLAAPDAFGAPGAPPVPRRLRGLLPSRGWIHQAVGCTQVVRAFLPPSAALAYAAGFDAERVLILGFVWDEGGTRRFAFWGWPKGDCSTVTPLHARGAL